MTEDLLEQRLSFALKALASEVFPSEVTAGVVAPSELVPALDGGGTTGPQRRRRSWWSSPARRLGVIGLVVGLGGAATGIAAATGAFTSGPHPAPTYGAAKGLTGPTGNAPGEVVRFVGPGPDGVTLKVVSASSHPNSGCIGLVISAPTAASPDNRAVTGSCTASGNVNEPPPTTSKPSSTDYDQVPYTWTGPTGRLYVIWYGTAPAGTTAVGEVGQARSGPPPALGPKTPTSNGFYALAIPKKLGVGVGFYDAAGQVASSEGGTPGHPPEQSGS